MADPFTITSEDFKEHVDSGRVRFLFDRRNADGSEAWKIATRHPLGYLNIPQPDAITAWMRETLQANPDRDQKIRGVDLGITVPDEEKQQGLKIGRNLCGMDEVRCTEYRHGPAAEA